MKHDLSGYFGFTKRTIHTEWVPKHKVKEVSVESDGKTETYIIKLNDGSVYIGYAIEEKRDFYLIKSIQAS